MPDKSKKQTFKFKYKFAENYNPVYVNGAFGGITTKGELAINFFFERHELPISETHEIDESGKLSEDSIREPKDQRNSAIRYIDTGIILSLEHAKTLHKWLEQKIEELEEVEEIKKTKQQKDSPTNKKK